MEPAARGSGFIGAVLVFNLAAMLMWFLFSGLRRSWEDTLKEVDTFLTLVARERPGKDAAAWEASIERIRGQMETSRGLGPIWGRRPANLARLSMHTMVARWPEVAGEVLREMER